jgi:hypothetical protein
MMHRSVHDARSLRLHSRLGDMAGSVKNRSLKNSASLLENLSS